MTADGADERRYQTTNQPDAFFCSCPLSASSAQSAVKNLIWVHTNADLIARAKTSLDHFWVKDKSLANRDNLPDPKDLAEDLVENIEADLSNFRTVLAALGE